MPLRLDCIHIPIPSHSTTTFPYQTGRHACLKVFSVCLSVPCLHIPPSVSWANVPILDLRFAFWVVLELWLEFLVCFLIDTLL